MAKSSWGHTGKVAKTQIDPLIFPAVQATGGAGRVWETGTHFLLWGGVSISDGWKPDP
jgi:hypothetical protein